jgi:hypothetical protein
MYVYKKQFCKLCNQKCCLYLDGGHCNLLLSSFLVCVTKQACTFAVNNV